MTSKNMTARHAYNSSADIKVNEAFLPLHLEMRGKALGLDFSSFDGTQLASTEVRGESRRKGGGKEWPGFDTQLASMEVRGEIMCPSPNLDASGAQGAQGLLRRRLLSTP